MQTQRKRAPRGYRPHEAQREKLRLYYTPEERPRQVKRTHKTEYVRVRRKARREMVYDLLGGVVVFGLIATIAILLTILI